MLRAILASLSAMNLDIKLGAYCTNILFRLGSGTWDIATPSTYPTTEGLTLSSATGITWSTIMTGRTG